MPLKNGHDKKGTYWRYGDNGSKYYYKTGDEKAQKAAKKKAIDQGVAINYSLKKEGKKPEGFGKRTKRTK